MSRVSIIGAYNTKFGAFVEKNRDTGEVRDLKSYYDLLIEAGRGAIRDAGLEARDIDAVYVGTCSPMHAMIYKQLIGQPIGARPRKPPVVGVVVNVGGAAVTNCVTVLRRAE